MRSFRPAPWLAAPTRRSCRPHDAASDASDYHPHAETELAAAAQYHERRLPTLGAQFLDAIDRAIGIILDDPEPWCIIGSDVRHYLMPPFPYAIYYRVLPDQIRVLAFKHHSRHPDHWHQRLFD